jgi:hypothetical protein
MSAEFKVVPVEGGVVREAYCVVTLGLARIAEFYGVHAEEYANLFVQSCQKLQTDLRRATDILAAAGGE